MCPAGGVCVHGGKQGIVKTFTSWQVLASWQVLGAVSVVSGLVVLGDMFLREYRQGNGGNS